MAIEHEAGTGPKGWKWSTVDLGCVVGLVVLAVIAFSLIQPSGEFPLNDDWAFILPVKWLFEQGRLRFTDWQFMTLIGQVAVGAGVASFTGFSITGLRWLVIGLAVASALLVYGIARATSATRGASLLTALLLVCNPIFVILAASFMTDVPFLTACLAAVMLRVTARGRWATARLGLAWLCVVLACSIRQSGVALTLGFIAFDWVQRGSARLAVRDSVLPALCIGLLIVAYPTVVERTIGLPSMFNQPNRELKIFVVGLLQRHFGFLLMALKNLLVAFGYLALCMAPLLPLIAHGDSKWRRPRVALVIAALTAVALIAAGRAAPLAGSTFFDFGLGVRTLASAGPAPTAPAAFWWTIAFVVGMGSAACVFAAGTLRWSRSVVRPSKTADRNACLAMLVTVLCVYNIPFLMRGGLWFDRYSLPDLALFGILVAPSLELPRRNATGLVLTAAMLTAYLAFGVAGTHDYIEWNRQRWLAADDLAMQRGTEASHIDGGFEYNNYQARRLGDRHRPADAVDLKNPNAAYRLAFSPLPGHTVVAVRPCKTWLYGSPTNIYVLRADSPLGG